MSRIIAHIEGEDIIESDNGVVSYTSKAAIDSDGTGPHLDKHDAQNETSYQPNLNSSVDRYIVTPPAIISGVKGIVMGSQAVVTNTQNRKSTEAVVGDIGPHHLLGEISIATAIAIGLKPSPVSGGIEEHVIHYAIFPGVAAKVNGKQYTLQRH
jgi:hypothetical protein